MTDEFVADGPACGCCGSATIPPYVGDDGYVYEGYYCEGCGATWSDPAQLAPLSCMMHRDA